MAKSVKSWWVEMDDDVRDIIGDIREIRRKAHAGLPNLDPEAVDIISTRTSEAIDSLRDLSDYLGEMDNL